MSIHDALSRLVIDYDEAHRPDGEVRAQGSMRFGTALEGPPGRLHGGHHAFVRTLPIVERITAHEHARTFPCSVDVVLQQGLNLEENVPFEATYRGKGDQWECVTRFHGTDRLVARAHSIPNAPLLSESELRRWQSLYDRARPGDEHFDMFGFTVHLSEQLVWLEVRDPVTTLPESQHAALVGPDGNFGAVFMSTQLDTVGATARGVVMRHPHFTKHIEIDFATGAIPQETHLVCMADRTRLEDVADSGSKPVEIRGTAYGTARTPVALVDTGFSKAYSTGWVTVHPVDPAKFEALQRMRKIRKDPGSDDRTSSRSARPQSCMPTDAKRSSAATRPRARSLDRCEASIRVNDYAGRRAPRVIGFDYPTIRTDYTLPWSPPASAD